VLALCVRYGVLPVTTSNGRHRALCWVMRGDRVAPVVVIDVQG